MNIERNTFYFSSFLLRVGFTQSKVDSSLFVYDHDSHIMMLLLYIDDVVLTGNTSTLLLPFIRSLDVEFDIKDLG